jgi:hypothetical protein
MAKPKGAKTGGKRSKARMASVPVKGFKEGYGLLDLKAVERIVAAVEIKPGTGRSPSKKTGLVCHDKTRLGEDLNIALLIWRNYEAWDRYKLPSREFRTFSKAAKRFKQSLQSIGIKLSDTDKKVQYSPLIGPLVTLAELEIADLQRFLFVLDRLIDASERNLNDFVKSNITPRLDRAPTDWFIVNCLKPIFKKHFGREPGINRQHRQRPYFSMT